MTTEMLADELFSEAMAAEGKGFTLTKELGTVSCYIDSEGNVHADENDRTQIQMNAAAVRLLGSRFPELNITYPQTQLEKKTVTADDRELQYTVTRTDAVIEVPESFVQTHCGAYFREILLEKWQPQMTELVCQITENLRRYELRTARMFGQNPDAGANTICVTEDTVESEIWTILMNRIGFYPLQWDGEICGMALLLAERLREALAEDCGAMLETAVRRDAAQKQCAIKLYYSIKQD